MSEIQKISGEGAQPPPQTPPRVGHPLPHPTPLGAFGSSILPFGATDFAHPT